MDVRVANMGSVETIIDIRGCGMNAIIWVRWVEGGGMGRRSQCGSDS